MFLCHDRNSISFIKNIAASDDTNRIIDGLIGLTRPHAFNPYSEPYEVLTSATIVTRPLIDELDRLYTIFGVGHMGCDIVVKNDDVKNSPYVKLKYEILDIDGYGISIDRHGNTSLVIYRPIDIDWFRKYMLVAKLCKQAKPESMYRIEIGVNYAASCEEIPESILPRWIPEKSKIVFGDIYSWHDEVKNIYRRIRAIKDIVGCSVGPKFNETVLSLCNLHALNAGSNLGNAVCALANTLGNMFFVKKI